MFYAGEVFNRPDFIWIGSEGKAGKKPEKKSSIFFDARKAVIRSGYDRKADYLLFRAGPPGAYHSHEDILSIEVVSRGTKKLVDPGITSYDRENLSDYYRSANAHNMILINGKGPDYSGLTFEERVKPARDNICFSEEDGLETVKGFYKGDMER